MTTQVKTDLQEGTFVQKGVLNTELDRAINAAVVWDDAGANVTLATAMTSLLASYNSADPIHGAPLQTIRISKFGDKVLGRGVYARASFGGSEADNPFAFASIDVVRIPVQWYADTTSFSELDTGYGQFPAGDVKVVPSALNGLFNRPVAWERTVAVLRIQVRVRLEEPAIGSLFNIVDTINQNNFVIADKTFLPKTLLFTSPSQQSQLFTTSTGEHRTTYVFLWRPDGWVEERLGIHLTEYKITVDGHEPVYPQTTWSGSTFPIA